MLHQTCEEKHSLNKKNRMQGMKNWKQNKTKVNFLGHILDKKINIKQTHNPNELI